MCKGITKMVNVLDKKVALLVKKKKKKKKIKECKKYALYINQYVNFFCWNLPRLIFWE